MKTMLNFLIKINFFFFFGSCKSKNDENYVKIVENNHNLGAFFFWSCKNKNDKNYVEFFHKNHNLIDLLVMQRAKMMQNMLKIITIYLILCDARAKMIKTMSNFLTKITF
jgi:hypothetical protein